MSEREQIVAWQLAEKIANSPAVISIYASPEWDELSEDGKLWVSAIVQETRKHCADILRNNLFWFGQDGKDRLSGVINAIERGDFIKDQSDG